MEKEKTHPQQTWNDQDAVELVRELRNNLIKDFLDERNILEYFAENYSRRELTTVKIQLIKKELKELLIAPVDLTHYGVLVNQIMETNTASISEKNESLFYAELEKVFIKYMY